MNQDDYLESNLQQNTSHDSNTILNIATWNYKHNNEMYDTNMPFDVVAFQNYPQDAITMEMLLPNTSNFNNYNQITCSNNDKLCTFYNYTKLHEIDMVCIPNEMTTMLYCLFKFNEQELYFIHLNIWLDKATNNDDNNISQIVNHFNNYIQHSPTLHNIFNKNTFMGCIMSGMFCTDKYTSGTLKIAINGETYSLSNEHTYNNKSYTLISNNFNFIKFDSKKYFSINQPNLDNEYCPQIYAVEWQNPNLSVDSTNTNTEQPSTQPSTKVFVIALY